MDPLLGLLLLLIVIGLIMWLVPMDPSVKQLAYKVVVVIVVVVLVVWLLGVFGLWHGGGRLLR